MPFQVSEDSASRFMRWWSRVRFSRLPGTSAFHPKADAICIGTKLPLCAISRLSGRRKDHNNFYTSRGRWRSRPQHQLRTYRPRRTESHISTTTSVILVISADSRSSVYSGLISTRRNWKLVSGIGLREHLRRVFSSGQRCLNSCEKPSFLGMVP
jgi:hypothetical protein